VESASTKTDFAVDVAVFILGLTFRTGERIMRIPIYPSFPIYLPAFLLILPQSGLF